MLRPARRLFSPGFTLIELMVVITIIAVLTAVGILSFSQAGINARNGKRKADLEQVRSALVLYRSDKGTYPVAGGTDDVAGFKTAMTALYPSYINQSSMTGPSGDAYHYYAPTGSWFNMCATIEPAGSAYCVTNP